MRIEGRWYSGDDAASTRLRLRLEQDGMLVLDPALAPPAHVSEVMLSARVGTIPRTITFPGGGLFETSEHERLDGWLGEQRRGRSLPHFVESRLSLVAAAVVVVAVALFAVVRWGIPAASERVAMQLPAPVHEQIAAGTLEELDNYLFEPTALPASRRAALTATFDRYAPGDDVMPYTLTFRGGGAIGPNAFALPDGTIVMTDELVALARNDEEVMAVLFHEMGHVYHRHSMRMVLSHSALALLALLIVGDVSAAGELVLALPGILTESSYSRALEAEADGYALERMRAHAFDPNHFANLMLRLEACAHLTRDELAKDPDALKNCEEKSSHDGAGDWLHYLSSHPATRQRIAAFRTD